MDLKYKFNAKEYATLNGISASALRKRRLSGKLEGQYIKKDSKSILQELLQARKIPLPDYEVVSIEGEAHCQYFKVNCVIPKLEISIEGEGSSRKIAGQGAAEEMLKKLKKILNWWKKDVEQLP